MSVRNAFACLDDSDEEPTQQVKSKAKTKAPAAAPAPARYNNRRDNNRRDNRGGRDNNRGRGDYNRDSADRRDNRGGRDNNRGGRGEYNRDAADSGARKYRRDDRRQDRRRDADRRDRRRDGNNQDQRRGRNQYEKSHQKRGPKKGGHGGWGTDKDAVDVTVEETATGDATPDAATPTEEGAADETPSEPAAPAVQELTLEEHEAAEKERRAQFNARWASSAPASKEDLAKDFSGMAVVSKKTRKAGADTWAAKRQNRKASSKSAQKAKELKKAIFAEPTHNHGGGDYGDRGRGRGGDRGRGRGGGGGRGDRGRDRRGGRGGRGGGGDYGYGSRGPRGGRDNQRGSGGWLTHTHTHTHTHSNR